MNKAEAYEPFYQFLKEPSDSEKWKALRGLVDNLVTETERNTIDRVLKIIDSYMDYMPETDWSMGLQEIIEEAESLKGGEKE